MPTLDPTEREDFLLIRKQFKEWVFFAGSVDYVPVVGPTFMATASAVGPNEQAFSGGQINWVQYRYTPATVNDGYEYGSIETFEYGQIYLPETTTDSGTPKPYVDLSRS
jgi:hypothetical protein